LTGFNRIGRVELFFEKVVGIHERVVPLDTKLSNWDDEERGPEASGQSNSASGGSICGNPLAYECRKKILKRYFSIHLLFLQELLFTFSFEF